MRSLRQIAEGSPSGGQSVQSGGTGQVTTAPASSPLTTVRRVTYFDMDDEDILEEPFVRIRMIKDADVFDMTYSDSDDEWCLCGT